MEVLNPGSEPVFEASSGLPADVPPKSVRLFSVGVSSDGHRKRSTRETSAAPTGVDRPFVPLSMLQATRSVVLAGFSVSNICVCSMKGIVNTAQPQAGCEADTKACPAGSRRFALSWLAIASPTCFSLLVHDARRAASRAVCTAGSRRPMSVAMIAITTSSSTSVKPCEKRPRGGRYPRGHAAEHIHFASMAAPPDASFTPATLFRV